jgi:predicted dehydrogenase
VLTFSTERAAETIAVDIDTEDAATVLLRFEGGARGSLALSQLSPGRKNSLEYQIDGAESAIAWDSERPDDLWIGHRDRPNEILLRNPALLNAAGRAAARLPGGHVEGFADTHAAAFRAVYEDVAAGAPNRTPPYATFADGHEEMVVGDAILASSREGRWVKVARSPGDRASDSTDSTQSRPMEEVGSR